MMKVITKKTRHDSCHDGFFTYTEVQGISKIYGY